jgi:hypothetical protein
MLAYPKCGCDLRRFFKLALIKLILIKLILIKLILIKLILIKLAWSTYQAVARFARL